MLKIKVAGYFPSITYSIIYQSDVTNHGGGRVALRDVEVMVVGDVVKVFFARTFVWGDVDPHGDGLGAGEPDGITVVVEVRASAMFESLDGGVEEAHA